MAVIILNNYSIYRTAFSCLLQSFLINGSRVKHYGFVFLVKFEDRWRHSLAVADAYAHIPVHPYFYVSPPEFSPCQSPAFCPPPLWL